MRLGGQFWNCIDTPETWISEAQRLGYRAVDCPLPLDSPDGTVRSYARAAEDAGILIAEVGAWSNPISPDETVRAAALLKCKSALDLADRIGARCCVNIAGARGEQWDGPHPANLTEETFDLIVASVRDIIDSVQPKRSFYTLETMPWIWPDSPESYLRLLNAIDRPQFAVHLDPVNMINCPARFFSNSDFIRECFRLLGPHIKSAHAKDITLRPNLTVHLDEVRPGLGGLDYPVFLRELSRLDPDTPLILEHLPNPEEYRLAADYIRAVAQAENIPL